VYSRADATTPLMYIVIVLVSITSLILQQNSIAQHQNSTMSSNTITSSSGIKFKKQMMTSTNASLVSLPLSRGYVNGKTGFFIATDASDNQTAASISDSLGHKINFATSLASIPQSAIQQGYEFLNGVKGSGAFGHQLPVATALPGDKGYSPIVQLNFVKWNQSQTPTELKSVNEIKTAESIGRLTITRTNIIINSPAIQ
jgi:hypothetical protein